MDIHARIFVAGHRGLVGSALVRRLEAEGADNLLLRTREQLDLTDQATTDAFFRNERPEYVFLAAAKVGGIHANATYPAEFIRDNLAIQLNVIHSAWRHGTRKLLFLGSSCIYPKHAEQPMREEALLTGSLEPTNEPYAIAKIAGLKMCQAYRAQYGFDAIVAMPTNLYGPGDYYDPMNSHVVPALIRRFHDAVTANSDVVTIWGSGEARREFMHVDDLASAAHRLMDSYSGASSINVGSGEEVTITELARLVAQTVGFTGSFQFDAGKPDGAPRKILDSTKLARMGWSAAWTLPEGLAATYRDFIRSST